MTETFSIQPVQSYSQKSSATKSSATILIVEDDPGLRYLLTQCLHKSNYQVVTIPSESEVSSESEVLRSLADHQIDLVMLDPFLSTRAPNKGQLSICQSIRQQHEVFIVVLGDLSPFNTKAYAQQLGADAYLGKPMRLAELYSCVQSLLAPRKG